MREIKDSGAEWIGDIPEDWTIRPHWAVLKEKKVPVGSFHSELTLLSLTKQGVIVRDMDAGGKFPASFEGYQRVDEGDLILCLFDVEETPRTVGLSPTSGMITSAYTVMRVSGVDARFLEWYLIGMDNEKRFKPFYSGLRNVLPKPVFGSIRFAMPSVEEQTQIVSYLNKETSQIDLLISKKEQLIEKLLERRQALITQAVTKGLDPNVPMKDSGVEWIGQVPSDWSAQRLRYLAQTITSPVDKKSQEGQDSVLLCNYTDVTRNDQILPSGEYMVATATTQQKRSYQLLAGDSVITKDSETAQDMGIAAFVRDTIPDLLCGYHLAIVRPGTGVNPRWLTWALRSSSTKTQFSANSRGLTRLSLGQNAMRSTLIPLPPLGEQSEIQRFLDEEIPRLDNLVGLCEKAIHNLKQRRQALITQVVTGKLDVRGFASGNS